MKTLKTKKKALTKRKKPMIKFIEDKHIYLNDSGEQYTSVTRLLHSFEPVKDWDKIASAYAKKHKKTLEEVKASWKEENRKSIERGSKFHKIMEDSLYRAGTVKVGNKHLKVHMPDIREGVKYSSSLKLEEGVYPELIIYLDSIKLAGQADYIEVVDGKINIKDYKTNKELKFEGFKDWKGKKECLTGPLSHIENCNYNLYCLQLNTYMYMLLKHNPKLKIGKMLLLHAQFDTAGNYTETIEYVVPNMQKDVKKMIA